MEKPKYTTNAINIKSYPLGEGDNILYAFSKENGLIKCIASGAKKPKSKLGARAQILVANKLFLNKGKNFDKIAQAETINSFSNLRKDFDRLNYSIYLADVISIFGNDTDKSTNEDIYDIFYNSLENISASKDKREVLLYVLKFQILLIQALGWGLDFKICSKCGKIIGKDAYFLKADRVLICDNCAKYAESALIRIHTKIKDFMLEISRKNIGENTIYDNIVNLSTLDICFNFMKKYLESLSGKKQKFTDFSESTSLNK